MRKLTCLLAIPLLLLAACGDKGSVISPGSTAPPGQSGPKTEPMPMDSVESGPETPSSNPIADSQIDERAISVAFRTLDLAASTIDALIQVGVLVPGTPRAFAVADGLDTARLWLNAASSAQRVANSRSALDAFTKATAAIVAVQAAIGGTK